MGAYSYCHKCEAPQDAPTIDDFRYGEPTCESCGVQRILPENFREVVIDKLNDLEGRLQSIETAVWDLANRNKDDGK
jgi:hypothetical protein